MYVLIMVESENQNQSAKKTMTSTYSAFCCEILSAIDGSTHSNEILDAALSAGCFKSHASHIVNIFVRRKFKTKTKLSVITEIGVKLVLPV